MVNPFLSGKNYDTETAIMLEKAYILDIGKAVAYTDGDKVFLNTQDNLFKLLPAYDDDMLFWLLWHEETHKLLKHHNRFFKYVSELDEKETKDKFKLGKDEVNIIMDILVHDWMAKKFPDKVETARKNLAQFRDCNALKYTFKTYTLEKMLEEYNKYKHKDETEEKATRTSGDTTEDDKEETKESSGDTAKEDKPKEEPKEDKPKEEPKEDKPKETKEDKPKETKESGAKEEPKESGAKEETKEPTEKDNGRHDEVDWEQLKEIDTKEFITEKESRDFTREIDKIKRTKIKLAQLTKTINGLVTTAKVRSYKTPSYVLTGQRTIFKGSNNTKASLYLCFDASGSMGRDMETFKEIISQAIPQAMKTPTEWFSGWAYDKEGTEAMKRCASPKRYNYYKGTFQDFMKILADSGYRDDGDRTIELCYNAEQQGYSPIGITDGGGQISWSEEKLKSLKRTIFVGHDSEWLRKVQKINPAIQTIYINL